VAAAERDPRPILCAFAITEPGGGSDVEEADGLATGDVRSYAVRVPGGYRLTGRKVFISNGSVADYTVFYAALDRADPLRSWTAFVVTRGSPGFRVARVEAKMGQRACPAAEIELEEVFVPTAMRVGAEGGAWQQTRQVLAVSRGPVGAIAVGTARGAYEAAVEYATAHPVEPWQEDLLASMVVRLRAARAAYLEATAHCDQVLLPGPMVQNAAAALGRFAAGRRALAAAVGELQRGSEEAWAHQCLLGSAAKVAGSDAAMAVTTAALDIIPPTAGLLRRRAEKAFRDAKLTQIYEGTNQINLRAIAHETFRRGVAPA
jgi:alkylation response protein AidB-like acyl-CoA dehydrogenase